MIWGKGDRFSWALAQGSTTHLGLFSREEHVHISILPCPNCGRTA